MLNPHSCIGTPPNSRHITCLPCTTEHSTYAESLVQKVMLQLINCLRDTNIKGNSNNKGLVLLKKGKLSGPVHSMYIASVLAVENAVHTCLSK